METTYYMDYDFNFNETYYKDEEYPVSDKYYIESCLVANDPDIQKEKEELLEVAKKYGLTENTLVQIMSSAKPLSA